MKRFVIAVYVENKYGVLARVSGMFMRKGFNIDTLTVGETDDPAFSRITVTLNGDDYECTQLINQLNKLYNVKSVKVLDKDNVVNREMLLLKVANTSENRSEIMSIADVYRAKIVDYTADNITMEVTGEPSKIQAFIDVMRPMDIVEMCRTGLIALERGSNILEK